MTALRLADIRHVVSRCLVLGTAPYRILHMKSLLIRRAALLVLVLIGALEYAAPGAAGDTADEAPAAVAVDTGDAAAGDPAPSISDHPRWGIALAEILGSNLAVNLFDRFVYETYFPAVPDNGWADTTWTSWEANLKGPWHFDEDPWSGNEIGHPYQGAIYYAAARSNGLDFWESAAGTALGAFTWEISAKWTTPTSTTS